MYVYMYIYELIYYDLVILLKTIFPSWNKYDV